MLGASEPSPTGIWKLRLQSAASAAPASLVRRRTTSVVIWEPIAWGVGSRGATQRNITVSQF